MEFSNTITIERSRHDVFEFLSDLENIPKWNFAIVETRKTSDGPVRVGTTIGRFGLFPQEARRRFRLPSSNQTDASPSMAAWDRSRGR
jgi:uncharacterized protein YndB with AHSA1/START domain